MLKAIINTISHLGQNYQVGAPPDYQEMIAKIDVSLIRFGIK